MDISTLGEKRMRLNNMLQDMITWAVWHKRAGGEKIFMVISKAIPDEEESDFVTLLESMCLRDYNICAGGFAIDSVVDPAGSSQDVKRRENETDADEEN
ncbi:hypothetical protein F2Q69_00062211 [Brassica cretica]|uniref:Uncharacterized protein n=1 Tax=Brassica cretica TaxID=69181 RepID=A0A8S9RBG9_BRACR|nr:hypothetical protein F2Q69_00062211 [Brassica cretica]